MSLRIYKLIAALIALTSATSTASAADLPEYLVPVASGIERCISGGDNEASKQYVRYDRLKSNWEIRWWSLLGMKDIPSETYIREHPDLWNAGTVVKLSLEQYCRDISGVKLLLHGGVSPDDVKDRKVFASLKSVELAEARVTAILEGDDGKPVVAVFELLERQWMLTDVILQMK